MTTTTNDEMYMRRALQLALNAEGETAPNPMVGCVIVRDGKILGEGWHHKAGLPHAEVEALKAARYRVQGATAYVTLEPCSHFGKVGPCCRTLVNYGITKVVCACIDPNPEVSGAGIKYLRDAGVDVITGVCQEEAAKLNEHFFFAVTHNRPFISLKYAMTMDGKIATANKDSEWITGEAARKEAHHLRKCHDAILVGIGTILQDNSELTTRLVKGKNPLRIVLDSQLRIPMTAAVLNDAAETLIFTGPNADTNRITALERLEHIKVIQVPIANGFLDLNAVMNILSQREIRSVLIEGGSTVHGSFVDAGLVDRIYAFIAPKICGGTASLCPVGGRGVTFMNDALQLEDTKMQQLGNDFLLTARIRR